MADVLHALTFWRPWTDAILHAGKRVENRPWVPWPRILGAHIALHAGRRYQVGDWPWPGGWNPPSKRESPEGIVGLARVVGALETRSDQDSGKRRIHQALMVGDAGAIARRLHALDEDPWWAGPVGWLLDDVVAIDPIPCSGALGLWRVPSDVAALVRARVEVARAKGAAARQGDAQ